MAARLFVEIGAKVGEFQKALGRIERDTARFSRKMEGLGRSLTQAITLPLGAAAGAGIAAFASFERLEKGLLAVMGDAKLAADEMERLKQSATLPGLGFEEAVRGSIRLQAVGLSAQEARETLEAFGTAIAATGGNAQNLDSVQYQLTQMISKNRILQEDFGILQENVPLLGKALEVAFGTTNLDAIRATGIGAQEFNQRIVQALNTLPELQNVTGGLSNSFDNFRDSIKFSLVELGRSISESINLSAIMDRLAGAVAGVVDWFKNLSPEMRKTLLIVGAVVAAIGPLLLLIGKLAALGPALVAGIKAITAATLGLGKVMAFLLSPVGLVVAAIAGLVALVVYSYNKFEGFRRIINGLIEVFVELGKIAKESFAALVEGFGLLREGEFSAAAAKFKEALVKSNPVLVAKTQGQRLGGAFAEGFADSSNRFEGTVDEIKQKITAATTGIAPGIATVPLSTISGPSISGTGEAPEDTTADDRQTLFSKRLRELAGSAEIARESVTLLEGALVSNVQPLEQLNERMPVFLGRLEEAPARAQALADTLSGALQQGFTGFFDTLLSGGDNAFKAFGDALKGLIKQLLTAVATAAALAAIFSIITGGGSAASGLLGFSGGGSLFGNLLKKFVPFLAGGGVITSPTLAMVGEAGPEAVIPLSKLNQFGGQTVVGGEFTIRGTDLVLAVERNQNQRRRSRGV